MPTTPHVEKHFTATETVRHIVIGMADGLTVPFALAAGLAAAVSSTSVIVTAGLAEIVAGAIAMGLGGYLAARTDAEHYGAERTREDWEIDHLRHREVEEVAEIFRGYGLDGDALNTVVSAVTSDRQRWLDFMMRFELGLEQPDPKRAPISAGTIAASYLVGGLIPLTPYMLVASIPQAFTYSVAFTGVTLVLFGGAKGTSRGPIRSNRPCNPCWSVVWRRRALSAWHTRLDEHGRWPISVRKSIGYQPLSQLQTDKHCDACSERQSDVMEMKIAEAE